MFHTTQRLPSRNIMNYIARMAAITGAYSLPLLWIAKGVKTIIIDSDPLRKESEKTFSSLWRSDDNNTVNTAAAPPRLLP